MVQEVKTTYEEKVKMYMRLTKKQLAEMMATRDQAMQDVKISTYISSVDLDKDIREIVDRRFFDMV